MSEIYELNAEPRSSFGKSASRRIRRAENKVPATIYGGDKDPISVVISHSDFAHALENEGFYSHILTLHVSGKSEKVVLKDIQRHPNRPRILHADFLRINPKTKLTMHIPLHFKGQEEAPGVKDQGGIISHHMTEVEVRCLPKDLPEFIEVDISNFNLDDSLHLSQLNVPKGVEIVLLLQGSDFDQPVVTVHRPQLVIEEEPAVTEEEAAEAEPTTEAPAESSAEGETKE